LGFEGVIENSYYAIGGIDYLLEATGALATAAISLGKFTQDLLLWATQEFSFITLNDGFVQTSSIMPQKRNPVALEHVRILLSRTFAQAQAIAASVHNTPFGDINDVEDPLQPLVYNTFSDAARAVKLLAGAVAAIVIDEEGLKQKASGSFLTMTELADTLVREEGFSFKMAHKLVALTVNRISGIHASHAEIAAELLAVAGEVLGRKLRTPREKLIAVLSPLHFVEVRQVFGGPAPNQVAEFLKRQKQIASGDQRWVNEKTKLLAVFPDKAELEKKRLIG
jgi:argininosuccinate lyase